MNRLLLVISGLLAIAAVLSFLSREPDDDAQGQQAQKHTTPARQETSIDDFAGQKHPPIPANNPIWEWDAGGFVPDFGWYGEHNWDDVRMRAIGHLSIAWRDLARVQAQQQQWQLAAQEYQQLDEALRKVSLNHSKQAQQIRTLLADAARRDSAWLSSIADKTLTTDHIKGSIAPLRAEYHHLVLRHQHGDNVSTESTELHKQLLEHNQLREDLKIDQFTDFKDRHKLRVRLFEAYLDSLDPLAIVERWGYWRPVEVLRQVSAIGLALELLGAPRWPLCEHFSRPSLPSSPSLLTPSELALRLRDDDLQLDNSAEEFGRLPTGDTLIDVAGQPGPMGIGSLQKKDVSHPEHRAWLLKKADVIIASIQNTPEQTPGLCREIIKELTASKDGSIFYNIKQLRNACTRQLARAQQLEPALDIFSDSFPLHHQDWACPNRQALLEATQGRIEALIDPERGTQRLRASRTHSLEFIALTMQAQQGTITGPRPPAGPARHPHNQQPQHRGPGPGPAHPAPPQQR